MLEALPDLGLPAAVVVLDRGLEAGLAGRREDRDDAQVPAQAGDSVEGIRPIDAIQSLVLGPLYPNLHGAQTDPKLLGHRAQRLPLPHRGHHRTPPLFEEVFRSGEAPQSRLSRERS